KLFQGGQQIMNEKFLAAIAGGLLAFGKVLELFPVIEVFANLFGGGVGSIFLTENLEEEF
ncbi:MAG: hypothetical protein II857_07100, partial [Selenomonadaceae bacterium]|nr:hypothetical protein [Selenomonadaceae bacterium]